MGGLLFIGSSMVIFMAWTFISTLISGMMSSDIEDIHKVRAKEMDDKRCDDFNEEFKEINFLYPKKPSVGASLKIDYQSEKLG